MKLILKDEVDNVGLAGDIVDVADGYGRNYLIPKGLAIRATKGAVKEAQLLTKKRMAREADTVEGARELAKALESRELKLAVRVDDGGNLYGSVTSVDVHKLLKERGVKVERKRIDLKGSVKSIGTITVPVQLHPQVTANVTVVIEDAEGKVKHDGTKVVTEEMQSIQARAIQRAREIEALEQMALAGALDAEVPEDLRRTPAAPAEAADGEAVDGEAVDGEAADGESADGTDVALGDAGAIEVTDSETTEVADEDAVTEG